MSELLLRKLKTRGVSSISMSNEVDSLFKTPSDKLQLIANVLQKVRFKPISTITFKNVTCSYRYKNRKLYIS